MVSSFGPVRHVVAWLDPVRWSTCALLWVVVAIVWALPHLELPLRAVAPFGLTAAIVRTLMAVWLRRGRAVPRMLFAVSLCADALLVTGLLDITGGPFNPFIVMYVTYVWLAFVTAGPRWGVLVTIVSIAGFGWLMLDHVQAEMAEHHRLNDFPTHLFTMWFSGSAIAELVAHYVSRARTALALRQRQLDEARERALRNEHLASLTTLAAGAAHELATPLATIAVAARELERRADRLATTLPAVDGLKADATLIRAEVDRCQVILDGMSGRAPDRTTAAEGPLTASTLAQRVRDRLPEDEQRRLRVDIASDILAPAVASAGMVQAISSLLRNAFQASDPGGEVVLRFEQRGSMVHVEVCDRGAGMLPEVARRAGEPFYTTKEPGQGMGLGLFLTRTFVERAGGTLRFESVNGTTAVLEIPAESTKMARS
jgi:two-component system sensor histidine kinase RegB